MVKTKSLCYLFVFILFNLIFIPLVLGATSQEILAELQTRYEKTNDLEAGFLQEYIGKVIQRPQKGEGKVYFKKKGMMRWDYRTPNQKLITNGHTLWYYQADENQVFVSDVANVLKEKTPLAFLAGEGDISRDFKLLNLNESVSEKGDHYILELVPKEPHAALSKVTLVVDKKMYYVVQTDIFDGLGNVTRTRFFDIRTNLNLPPFLFHFSIPPGAEVLKMKGSSIPSSVGKETPGKVR